MCSKIQRILKKYRQMAKLQNFAEIHGKLLIHRNSRCTSCQRNRKID